MAVTLEQYNAAITENEELEAKRKAIIGAIGKVNMALKNMRESEENPAHSYDWIINNVDNYWNVEGNGASSAKSQMVGDLTKLRDDFMAEGNFESVVADVIIKAANDKVTKYDETMKANDAIIEEYEAASAADEEEDNTSDEGTSEDEETSDEDEE